MDVQNSVSDVSSRPLKDLSKIEPKEEKVGVPENMQTGRADTGFVVFQIYFGKRDVST